MGTRLGASEDDEDDEVPSSWTWGAVSSTDSVDIGQVDEPASLKFVETPFTIARRPLPVPVKPPTKPAKAASKQKVQAAPSKLTPRNKPVAPQLHRASSPSAPPAPPALPASPATPSSTRVPEPALRTSALALHAAKEPIGAVLPRPSPHTPKQTASAGALLPRPCAPFLFPPSPFSLDTFPTNGKAASSETAPTSPAPPSPPQPAEQPNPLTIRTDSPPPSVEIDASSRHAPDPPPQRKPKPTKAFVPPRRVPAQSAQPGPAASGDFPSTSLSDPQPFTPMKPSLTSAPFRPVFSPTLSVHRTPSQPSVSFAPPASTPVPVAHLAAPVAPSLAPPSPSASRPRQPAPRQSASARLKPFRFAPTASHSAQPSPPVKPQPRRPPPASSSAQQTPTRAPALPAARPPPPPALSTSSGASSTAAFTLPGLAPSGGRKSFVPAESLAAFRARTAARAGANAVAETRRSAGKRTRYEDDDGDGECSKADERERERVVLGAAVRSVRPVSLAHSASLSAARKKPRLGVEARLGPAPLVSAVRPAAGGGGEEGTGGRESDEARLRRLYRSLDTRRG
ncbi:hypothetical protein JCM10207_000846 [Rhodosporidiobolus poonsookiae]